MTRFNDHINRILEISDESKKTDSPEAKELLEKEFWNEAIAAFNEDIAGNFATIDGRLITISPISI